MRNEIGLPLGTRLQIAGSEVGLLGSVDHNQLMVALGLTVAIIGAITTIQITRRASKLRRLEECQ